MSVGTARLFVRLLALWTAACAFVVLWLLAGGLRVVFRVHGPLPASIVVVPLLMGVTAVLGVFGALRLWRRRPEGRVASIISGLAVIVGVAPAALLRSDMLAITGVMITGVVVCGLLSRPVRSVCATGYPRQRQAAQQ